MMLINILIPFLPEYYKELVVKNNTLDRDRGTSRLSGARVFYLDHCGDIYRNNRWWYL